MKNRYIVSIIIIIGVALSYYLNVTTETSPLKEISDQKNIDIVEHHRKQNIEQFKRSLSPEISESEFFEMIVDFAVDPHEILKAKKIPLEKVKKHIQQGSKEILTCLPNLCGAKRTKDGLLQEHATLAHQSLERYLEVLIANPNLEGHSLFNEDTFLTILAIPNSTIQSHTLTLLNQSILEGSIQVNQIVDKLVGEALPKLIGQLSNQEETKSQALDLASEVVKNADSYSIIILAQNLTQVNLSEVELTDLAKDTCHLKNTKGEERNYKMVSHLFNKKAQEMGETLNWLELCP